MPTSTLLVLALLAAAVAAPAERRNAEECEAVKQEIRKVQARMRRGYGAAEGVKLNEKLLELRERRAKVCR